MNYFDNNKITTKKDFEHFICVSLMREPFLASISRYIEKIYCVGPELDLNAPVDLDAQVDTAKKEEASNEHPIKTMAVSFNRDNDNFNLYYNINFIKHLTKDELFGVLLHELYHIIFGHCSERIKQNAAIANIAYDLAINSIIVHDHRLKLPNKLFLPGVKPDFSFPANGEISEEVKKSYEKLSKLIEEFPTLKTGEFYYKRLMEFNEQNSNLLDNKNFEIVAGNGQFDSHEDWEDIPDDIKEYIKEKIKDMVSKSVNDSDSRSGGWGNMSMTLKEMLRKIASKTIKWENVLKCFVGSINRSHRTSSFKKINKRYSYIHPGTKRGYVANVAMFIDQSGSMSNEDIERVFAELSNLNKKTKFDVYFFDTEVDTKNIISWKKNTNVKFVRVCGGGTDFNAPTSFVNDPKRRGKYDGYIILTDGDAPKPIGTRVKRAWITVPNTKLGFDTNELTARMEAIKE